ncbi:MAG: DUF4286 family protein [Balneolales bacterium]|nr:DUF4286 family protein [Balneolales bacterium]
MIYAVTIFIDKSVEKEWCRWMVEHHIPNVLSTKLFLGCRMMKSLNSCKDGSKSAYRMQYVLSGKDKLEEYEERFAGEMRAEANLLFAGKFEAERDVLEVLREF